MLKTSKDGLIGVYATGFSLELQHDQNKTMAIHARRLLQTVYAYFFRFCVSGSDRFSHRDCFYACIYIRLRQ